MITLAKRTPTYACTYMNGLRVAGPVVKVTESDVTLRVEKVTGISTGIDYTERHHGHPLTRPVTECDLYR